MSTRAACCSAAFKGLPVGTEIKLQKPGDLLQERSQPQSGAEAASPQERQVNITGDQRL